MRTFLSLLVLAGMASVIITLSGQTAEVKQNKGDSKQATAESGAVVPKISDRERAEFLSQQIQWMNVQKRYEMAFQKEPEVVAFDASVQKLQKLCQDGGAQFNPQTAQCVEGAKPRTEPVGPGAGKAGK